MSFNYRQKKNLIRGLTIAFTFIVTVILPLYIYSEALKLDLDPDVDISSYLQRLTTSTIELIIVGIIMMILLLVSYLINPLSVNRLIISIVIKVLYIIYIIVAANSEIFEILTGNVYLKVNLSVLNLFILPIPVLFIIRAVVKYIFDRKDLTCALIILEAISVNNVNSQIKLRRWIRKNKEIKPSTRNYLLRNFNELIKKLQTPNFSPLITTENIEYNITEAGQHFLKNGGYKKKDRIDPMETWMTVNVERLIQNPDLKKLFGIKKPKE